jgi:hypothetical protein
VISLGNLDPELGSINMPQLFTRHIPHPQLFLAKSILPPSSVVEVDVTDEAPLQGKI